MTQAWLRPSGDLMGRMAVDGTNRVRPFWRTHHRPSRSVHAVAGAQSLLLQQELPFRVFQSV